MLNILAIPGSLRATSSSNALLRIIEGLMPSHATLSVYKGIGSLPHFNDSNQVPASVLEFREKVRLANAVLICTPEYAFGIPGSLKNAIDWTVGSGEFVNKRVALITASSHGEKGHASMLLVLSAVGAKVSDDTTLLISSIRSLLNENGDLKDEETLVKVRTVINSLFSNI